MRQRRLNPEGLPEAGEPRWFDLAEAITGERPKIEYEDEEEDWD